jgi:hypothetical protein
MAHNIMAFGSHVVLECKARRGVSMSFLSVGVDEFFSIPHGSVAQCGLLSIGTSVMVN